MARLGAEADTRAVTAAWARLAAAEDALAIAETAVAAAGDAEAEAAAARDRRNARNRVKGAQKNLQSLNFLDDVASVFAIAGFNQGGSGQNAGMAFVLLEDVIARHVHQKSRRASKPRAGCRRCLLARRYRPDRRR